MKEVNLPSAKKHARKTIGYALGITIEIIIFSLMFIMFNQFEMEYKSYSNSHSYSNSYYSFIWFFGLVGFVYLFSLFVYHLVLAIKSKTIISKVEKNGSATYALSVSPFSQDKKENVFWSKYPINVRHYYIRFTFAGESGDLCTCVQEVEESMYISYLTRTNLPILVYQELAIIKY